MTLLEVRLLGRPAVVRDGETAPPPRGAKPWGLLAYLAASERAVPRSELAALLFGEAADPLGALRWNLAALRRLLDLPDALKGDEIELVLPAGAIVDTQVVEAGDPVSLELPGLGHELLAGLSFADSPVFETWLLSERRRLVHRSTSLISEAALTALAGGDYEAAIRWATALVGLDAFDEGHQALLIRAHALSGDDAAAQRQFEQCRDLLDRELSVEPGPAVVAAAHVAVRQRAAAEQPGRPEIVAAHLDVAWQSFLGGAVDHAIDLGRGAVAMADRCDDEGTRWFTRTYLGAMLSMTVRGWDEASTLLNEAIHQADSRGGAAEEATSLGVLAGTELMRADYEMALAHATRGAALSDDQGARSVNLMFIGAVLADTGHLDQAVAPSNDAVAAAEESFDPVRVVYATSHASRIQLMRGDLAAARALVERALAESTTMLVLRPWPLAILAEIDVGCGDIDSAVRGAEQAGALAATTSVSYQRALASRASGLALAARGDDDAAIDRLTEALVQARWTSGEGYTFHWPVTFILESLSAVTARTDPATSRRWADTLLEHASAIGMRDFATRAEQHRDAADVALGRRSSRAARSVTSAHG